MKKTIITHFFTTINFSIFLRMFLFIINPFNFSKLKNWKYVKLVEEKLLKYLDLNNSKIISFYNARSALFHALNILELKKGDEVIIQAYTCVSVINSVIQTWAKIIYCDIDETLNIDINDLNSKINPNTKVIIAQHTFWNPAGIYEIKKICKEKNIVLIEDCAHSLGAEFEYRKVWSFADLSIFSFWRDKVISTVNAWFLIINNEKYFPKIEEIKKSLIDLNTKEVLKNIFYIFSSFKAKIFYDFFGLWKMIIFISRKLKLIPEVLETSEKNIQSKDFFYKYPNALAYIWFKEIDKIDIYNEKRVKIAKLYEDNLQENRFPKTLKNSKNIYLRFVYFSKKRDEVKEYFKQNNILLWDWYDKVIAPKWVNFEKTNYIEKSCPNAEKYAQMTLNLPNHPWLKEKDFLKVFNILQNIEK